MSSASTRGSRFSITSSLSDTFAPPRIATNGRSGLLEHAAEMLELGGHQQARRGFLHVPDDAFRRRVRPMRRSERVVDVDVREIGELLREGGVVLFFLRVEAQILEQHDAMRRAASPIAFVAASPTQSSAKTIAVPEQLSGARGHRLQRVLGIRLALRAPEMASRG